MKRLLATILSLVCITNLALPQLVAAEAGTENYCIDTCEFSDNTGNWEPILQEGVTGSFEDTYNTADNKYGNSYVIRVPADKAASLTFSRKKDSFEHGEVTIEADFRYNTSYSRITLFDIKNNASALAEHSPNVLSGEKIGGNTVAIHEWHHIKYVVNINEGYSHTYIDGQTVSECYNVSYVDSFSSMAITLGTIDGHDLEFVIDNITIKKTQTDKYSIDTCEFSDNTGNWEPILQEGVTGSFEDTYNTADNKYGNSYVIRVPANKAASLTFSSKKDSFERGEVTIEADFRYNTSYSRITLFDIKNNASALAEHTPNILSGEKIGGNTVAIHEWHHIKYVVNIDKGYSRTYIDGQTVSECNNVSNVSSFSSMAITLGTIEGRDLEFVIDNITIKKTQSNINRASICNIECYTVSGASYGSKATELTSGALYANITMSKPVHAVPIRSGAIDVTVNGKPVKCTAYAGGAAAGLDYTYGWDDNYISSFTLYFGESFPEGSEVKIDLRDLYDENGYRVSENCVKAFTIAGDVTDDIKLSLIKDDGTQIFDIAQAFEGEKVRATATFINKLANVGEDALLVIASYDGSKQLDFSAENITIPSSGVVTTDYLTVEKSKASDYKLKSFVILKRNIMPLTGADTFEAEAMGIKSELCAELSAFTPFADTTYTSSNSALAMDYSSAKKYFADTICFAVDSNFFWGLDGRYRVTDKVLWHDGDIYASVDMMNKIFGTRTYTFAVELEGKMYVPVKRAATEVLNLYASTNDMGFATVSGRKIVLDNNIARTKVEEMLYYIIGERPTREMLKTLLADATSTIAGTKERFAEIKAKIEAGDKQLRLMSDSLIYQANNPSYNMPEYSTQSAGAYYGMSPNDVMNYFWAYYITGDSSYADKAIADAVEMASWGSYFAETFFLQTSYAISTLAYTLDLFQDELTSTQKSNIRNAIINKGLKPALNIMNSKTPGWAKRTNNWNTYCNSGVIIAALAVNDDYTFDKNTPFEALEKAIFSLQYQSLEYGPNGGYEEGLGYSHMADEKYVTALTALESVCGTDFSLSAVPGFLTHGDLQPHMSSRTAIFATGDTGNLRSLSSAQSAYAAYKLNDINMQRLRESRSDAVYTLIDLVWHMDDEDQIYTLDKPLDMHFVRTEQASARSDWGVNATYLGINAGSNSYSSDHYDAGTFAFHSEGVVFAGEMGREASGMAGYDNHGEVQVRQNFYVTRAEGHNVFVVNPDETAGQSFYGETKIEVVESKPKGAIFKIDLTPAYNGVYKLSNGKATNQGMLRSAERTFMLTSDRKVFVLQDEIVPNSYNDKYYWFWHTPAEIQIVNDSHIQLQKEGKTLNLYFDSNVPFELSSGISEPLVTSPNPSGQLVGVALMNKITAKFTSNSDKVLFRVTAVPGNMTYIKGSLTPASNWRIADGIRANEYDIGTDTVSGVRYGTTVEKFLSNIFAENSKKVMLNGVEVKEGIVQHGMTLFADGITYDIVHTPSRAIFGPYPIFGYTEEDTIEQLVDDVEKVLDEDVIPSITEGNVVDGMTIRVGDTTYTVMMNDSYEPNTIEGVLADTPTVLLLKELEPIIGEATADSDFVYNGMKILAGGSTYTIIVDEPDWLEDYDSYAGTVFGTSNFSELVPGFDTVHFTSGTLPGEKVKLQGELTDGDNRALHIASDGTMENDVILQMFKEVKNLTAGKTKLEFKLKTDTERNEVVFEAARVSNNQVVADSNMISFNTDGTIKMYDRFIVGYWNPDEWYHVEIEFNPINEEAYSVKINGMLVYEGKDSTLYQQLNRFKVRVPLKTGATQSIWLDNVRLTKIYG